jgi:hypothetical protein
MPKVVFLLLGLLLGAATPTVVTYLSYPGANVRCIENGAVCVGMSASEVFGAYQIHDRLGGLMDLTCGFVEPGHSTSVRVDLSGVLRGDCADPKLVLSFTKGGDLTNLWIDNDRIVRIDRYPNWPSGWP